MTRFLIGGKMRKIWTIEQRVKGQNQRAKQTGARHDLTVEHGYAYQVLP